MGVNIRDMEVNAYYVILMILAITKSVLCMFKYRYRYQLEIIKNELYPIENILMIRITYMFVIELLASMCHPSLFLVEHSFTTFNTNINLTVGYSLNSIFQIFNIVKFVHQLLEVFSILKYNCLPIQRINRYWQLTSNSWWTPLKNYITNESFNFMIYSFLLSMFIFSGTLLILERPAALLSGNNFTEWRQALWFTIITLLTIGYGDVRPNSSPGNFMIMIIVIWGNFWSSVFLTTIFPYVQLSIQEEKALNLQNRLSLRKRIAELSAQIITQVMKFNRVLSSNKKQDQATIQVINTKAYFGVRELRFLKSKYHFELNESTTNYHDILAQMEVHVSSAENQLRRAKTMSSVIINIFNRLQKNLNEVRPLNEKEIANKHKSIFDEERSADDNDLLHDLQKLSQNKISLQNLTDLIRRDSKMKKQESSESDFLELYDNLTNNNVGNMVEESNPNILQALNRLDSFKKKN